MQYLCFAAELALRSNEINRVSTRRSGGSRSIRGECDISTVNRLADGTRY